MKEEKTTAQKIIGAAAVVLGILAVFFADNFPWPLLLVALVVLWFFSRYFARPSG